MKSTGNRIKSSRTDRLFNMVNVSLMTFILIIIIYPLFFVGVSSFTDPNVIASGEVYFLPSEFSLEGYKKIFEFAPLWRGYLNTIIYTVLGTVINLACTLPAAFALSRKNLTGRNFIMLLFIFTMFFGGGMIPSYLLVRNLGLYNTIWAMVIPGAVSVWNLIVCRTFMQTNIPSELYEASSIDGCNDFQFFFRVVLPLSKPIIAIMILFYAIGHWNNYFSALIYLENSDLYPLQMVLRNLLIQNQISVEMGGSAGISIAERAMLAEQMKYGVILVSSLPMIIAVPFLQKYFKKGALIGSLKG